MCEVELKTIAEKYYEINKNKTIIQEENTESVKFLFNQIISNFDGDQIKPSLMLHKPLVCDGSISIEFMNICNLTKDQRIILSTAIREADITELCPLNDGRVQMNFSFNNLATES